MSTGDMLAVSIFGVISILVIFIWSMNIWGGWAEKIYLKLYSKESSWLWLRFFRISASEENCIRYLKLVSGLGILLVTGLWCLGLFYLKVKVVR
jgi:hypothetical protein